MGGLDWSGRGCLPELQACPVLGSGGLLYKCCRARPVPSQARQELETHLASQSWKVLKRERKPLAGGLAGRPGQLGRMATQGWGWGEGKEYTDLLSSWTLSLSLPVALRGLFQGSFLSLRGWQG